MSATMEEQQVQPRAAFRTEKIRVSVVRNRQRSLVGDLSFLRLPECFEGRELYATWRDVEQVLELSTTRVRSNQQRISVKNQYTKICIRQQVSEAMPWIFPCRITRTTLSYRADGSFAIVDLNPLAFAAPSAEIPPDPEPKPAQRESSPEPTTERLIGFGIIVLTTKG